MQRITQQVNVRLSRELVTWLDSEGARLLQTRQAEPWGNQGLRSAVVELLVREEMARRRV